MSTEGGPWAHIETPNPSSADGVSAATANAPYTLTPDGRYVSPDGRYYWSGSAWLPVTPAGYGESTGSIGLGAMAPNAAPWGTPPTQTDSPGLAIASLVLGILWLFGVGSLLAVIFGHISLSRISRGEASGRGRAIAGLVLGYIGLAVMVLAALGLTVSSSNEATSAGSGRVSGASGGNQVAQSFVRNAATAEEVYAVDAGVYTANPDDLKNDGFFTDQSISILVHVTHGDYCLIGSNTDVTHGRVWYTFTNGSMGAHSSKTDAERACGDTNPSDYHVLSGNGS